MKYFLPFFLVLFGLFLIVGTICKLQFLVDPPTDESQGSSFTFIKKYFGKKALIVINYLFGALSIVVGFIFIYQDFLAK